MGKINQLYGKWVRLLLNPDNPNELYLVIEKDVPMDKKYIRQFENMFQGKDIILTIGVLIRHKNIKLESIDERISPLEEAKKQSDKKAEPETNEKKHSPFWDVEE